MSRSRGRPSRRRWLASTIAIAAFLGTCGALVRAGTPTPGTVVPLLGAPASYIAAACAPSFGSYDAYGATFTSALSARYALRPAFDNAGDVFVATAISHTTGAGSTEYYYSGIEEIAPGGSVVNSFNVPISTDLQFAVSNGYLAYVATGGTSQQLAFINLSTQTPSSTILPNDTVYHLGAIEAGFVLTTQYAPVGDEPGAIQTFSPNGGLLSSTTLPGDPGESTVRLALTSAGAYVLSSSTGGSGGTYPSDLYTIDGTTGAISAAASLNLGEPNDSLIVLPSGDLLFANGTDQPSVVETWHPGTAATATGPATAPARVWSQTATLAGGLVPDGTHIWSGGGLHPVQSANGSISFTGSPGISQLSLTSGAPGAAVDASAQEPIWPLGAGPYGAIGVTQGSSNALVVFNPGGQVVQTYPLTLPPDTAIHAWTFNVGSDYVMLSNLFPGQAFTWPTTGCAAGAATGQQKGGVNS